MPRPSRNGTPNVVKKSPVTSSRVKPAGLFAVSPVHLTLGIDARHAIENMGSSEKLIVA